MSALNESDVVRPESDSRSERDQIVLQLPPCRDVRLKPAFRSEHARVGTIGCCLAVPNERRHGELGACFRGKAEDRQRGAAER